MSFSATVLSCFFNCGSANDHYSALWTKFTVYFISTFCSCSKTRIYPFVQVAISKSGDVAETTCIKMFWVKSLLCAKTHLVPACDIRTNPNFCRMVAFSQFSCLLQYSLSLHRHEPPMIHRSQPRSMCLVTFKYFGQIVKLDCEKEDPRDEVEVYQQHCGGENLRIYKGTILPGGKTRINSNEFSLSK